MKIYHFTIIFAIFAILIIMVRESQKMEYFYDTKAINNLETVIDKAVEDAAWELRASDTVYDEKTDKKAINSFYYSLYASLGIMDSPVKRENIKNMFPMFIISLKDGYYIYMSEWIKDENGFSIDYARSAEKYDYEKSASEELFEQKELKADENGYFGRTGEGTGFSAVVDWDYKIIDIYDERNSFANNMRHIFSAGIIDTKKYVVDKDYWYHEENCMYCGELLYVMFSKQGCAESGARACRYCIDR